MNRIVQAQFSEACAGCGGAIDAGDALGQVRSKWVHTGCADRYERVARELEAGAGCALGGARWTLDDRDPPGLPA